MNQATAMNQEMMTRRVKVDRSRTPERVVTLTGWAPYTGEERGDERDIEILHKYASTMSEALCEDAEVELFFFQVQHRNNPGLHYSEEIEKEYEARGLMPDPYALAAFNEANPTFAAEYPNFTQWVDYGSVDATHYYLGFNFVEGERYLSLMEGGYDFDEKWWCAGVRKVKAKLFNPATYFVHQRAYVWANDFDSLVLPAYPDPLVRRGIEGVEFTDLPGVEHECPDQAIIADHFGGEEEARKSALSLDQIADLIDAQKKVEKGILLTDGRGNVFYVIGTNDELVTVVVRHPNISENVWVVDAQVLDDRPEFYMDGRVFYNKR